MQTIDEFRKKRNDAVYSEYNRMNQPGMKQNFIHKTLSQKFKIPLSTIISIIQKEEGK